MKGFIQREKGLANNSNWMKTFGDYPLVNMHKTKIKGFLWGDLATCYYFVVTKVKGFAFDAYIDDILSFDDAFR
jgi:hypothetical protein